MSPESTPWPGPCAAWPRIRHPCPARPFPQLEWVGIESGGRTCSLRPVQGLLCGHWRSARGRDLLLLGPLRSVGSDPRPANSRREPDPPRCPTVSFISIPSCGEVTSRVTSASVLSPLRGLGPESPSLEVGPRSSLVGTREKSPWPRKGRRSRPQRTAGQWLGVPESSSGGEAGSLAQAHQGRLGA